MTLNDNSPTNNPAMMPSKPKLHSLGDGVERLRSKWGWFFAYGIVTAVMGMLALVLVGTATIASVYMIAFFMILVGGAEIAMGLRAKTWGWLAIYVVVGLLYVVAGAFALAQPLVAAAFYTLMLGAALLVTGLLRIFAATKITSGPKGLLILAGIITAMLGLMIIMDWPGASTYVLGLFLGLDLLFYGTGWAAFAMRLRTL